MQNFNIQKLPLVTSWGSQSKMGINHVSSHSWIIVWSSTIENGFQQKAVSFTTWQRAPLLDFLNFRLAKRAIKEQRVRYTISEMATKKSCLFSPEDPPQKMQTAVLRSSKSERKEGYITPPLYKINNWPIKQYAHLTKHLFDFLKSVLCVILTTLFISFNALLKWKGYLKSIARNVQLIVMLAEFFTVIVLYVMLAVILLL